jgi:hypothetical protein
LLISREGQLVVMPGILAEDFSTELEEISVPVGARAEAPTHLG